METKLEEKSKERKPFLLTPEELLIRKGYPGKLYVNYPNTENWTKTMIVPHPNFKPNKASYYRTKYYKEENKLMHTIVSWRAELETEFQSGLE